MITYEYPLIERVRTLLRLEDLFDRIGYFLAREDAHEHHVVLHTLFEILEVASRSELKSELLQEIERQRQALGAFKGNAEIDAEVLANVLSDLGSAHAGLFNSTGKIGQHLRENEWLMALKQRMSIPGGTSEFDQPHYHHWLHRAPAERVAELQTWISPLVPIHNAAAIVLKLLRESGKPVRATANRGAFQQMLGGRVAQMVRLRVASAIKDVPEISANRYALNIRFTALGGESRPRQAENDIEFELTFCSL